MSVHLPTHLLHRIQAHAEEAYPYECCGFLLGCVEEGGQRIVHEVEPVTNAAAEEGSPDRYRIMPTDYLRIDRKARAKRWEILGCYHSHPDGTAVPSAVDLACAWSWYAYLIVAVQDGSATEWRCWMLEDESDGEPQRFRPADVYPACT